jgi:glycosyltransferase involved in cell wall biosynthesis
VKNGLNAGFGRDPKRRVLMLLSNDFHPDPRTDSEARSLVEHGYDVLVLAWDREVKRPTQENRNGITVHRIHLRSRHGRGVTQAIWMPAITALMITGGLKYSFDLVHAHDLDTLPAAYFLSRWKRVPLVYDAHEDYAGMHHGRIPSWMERLIRWLEERLLPRTDVVITVGEKLRKDLERRGSRRTVVVGNWKKVTDYRFTPEVRETTRHKIGIPSSALLLSYVGMLGPDRKLLELLAAVATRPAVHLVIGGRGPQSALVQDYAARYPNIHYLGFVDPSEVPIYTWASDALYYALDKDFPNSHYSAPNKLFEALAAGKCIIASSVGEIEAIVRETDCGVLVENISEQEIARALDLCSDPARLEHWKSRASHAGEAKYNWARAEQELLRAYEQVLST